MKRILIKNAVIVNEGRKVPGSVVIEGEKIAEILVDGQEADMPCDETIDASGCYLLPGAIDEHVHFRDPGLTHKADITTESHAAAAGGVTSIMDMPNTNPQTTTLEALNDKLALLAEKSSVNFSCYFGATNNNYPLFSQLDKNRVCGVKLFMGSSTGNIAFSLRTGDKDTGFYRNTLTGYVLEAFDSLAHQHPGYFTHKIELIPGMGHSIDYRPTTPWLKQYVRNPYPKYVSWENFEMDGLYRKGFYNLYVKEKSDEEGKSRTYYEMSISGNHISLKVDDVVYEATEKDQRWGIEMKFAKKYVQAHKGKVVIYLCDELVDLTEKVTLTVNGKKVFEGKVKADLKNMVNSCAVFFDPQRLYPAAIEVELK